MKIFIQLLLLFAFSSFSNAKDKIDFEWQSANNWKGGEFKVPTWFAPDMKVSGYEVLHFHKGYYNPKSVGYWSYVFVLIVNELNEPKETFLIEETRRYFVGLGRILGDKKNPNLSISNIKMQPSSKAYKSPYTGKVQDFKLTAFDSWKSAKPIKLNTRIYTWLCKDGDHRAIVYAISPQPKAHPIWDQLTAEVHQFSCK